MWIQLEKKKDKIKLKKLFHLSKVLGFYYLPPQWSEMLIESSVIKVEDRKTFLVIHDELDWLIYVNSTTMCGWEEVYQNWYPFVNRSVWTIMKTVSDPGPRCELQNKA